MKRPEQQLHRAVARYLDVCLPLGTWWTTIPAGGGGKIRGAHLKAMGYKAGTPDILIVSRGNAYFIELKSRRGTLSPEQADIINRIHTVGSDVMLCRSIDDVERALIFWKIIPRASVARAA